MREMLDVGELHVELGEPVHERCAGRVEGVAQAGRVAQTLHDGRRLLLQVVPPLVHLLHHQLHPPGAVGSTLLGEAAVLLVDGLQLVQVVVDVALETLEKRKRKRNVLFNDALNTFCLRLYGVRHMVKDHSDSEKGNPLPPHRLLFSINSKGSFICTIPQTG